MLTSLPEPQERTKLSWKLYFLRAIGRLKLKDGCEEDMTWKEIAREALGRVVKNIDKSAHEKEEKLDMTEVTKEFIVPAIEAIYREHGPEAMNEAWLGFYSRN